tara:strand:- start:37 stop:249 length:213 start_codon:yes stop_codon:yes gene_type:complete
MSFILKRIGLIIYGNISIWESLANFALYVTHLDIIIKPVDWSIPFYFWYTNKFIKGSYIANLKTKHGQDI